MAEEALKQFYDKKCSKSRTRHRAGQLTPLSCSLYSMRHWLIKSEPSAYSWNNLLHDTIGTWDGVRNFQARNNLRAMKEGDLCLFYHSVTEKAVVGICHVVAEHFPDPSDPTGTWSAVKVAPLETFPKPVDLATLKADESLANFALLRQSRLSVVPATAEEFNHIRALGGL